MVEAVTASLLLAVPNGEIGFSAQGLNRLIDDGPGFPSILLVGGDGGRRAGCLGRRPLRRGILRPLPCMGPGRTHQNQNRQKLFHSLGSDRVQSEL